MLPAYPADAALAVSAGRPLTTSSQDSPSRGPPMRYFDPGRRSASSRRGCADNTGLDSQVPRSGTTIDLRALCRARTSRRPDTGASCPLGETSGRGNHDDGDSSAEQNQTTSVSLKEANPGPGRKARQTAGRGAGTAQAGSESRSCPTLTGRLSGVPDPKVVDPLAGL